MFFSLGNKSIKLVLKVYIALHQSCVVKLLIIDLEIFIHIKLKKHWDAQSHDLPNIECFTNFIYHNKYKLLKNYLVQKYVNQIKKRNIKQKIGPTH